MGEFRRQGTRTKESRMGKLKFVASSDYRTRARIEFQALGYEDPETLPEDDANRWIQENVLELLGVFSNQGHSGFSAPFCVEYFYNLALQKPLAPLTGEEWEWADVSEFWGDGSKHYQNKRSTNVFKDDSGIYNIDGKIFREPNGCCYSSKDSWVYIESFPYTPTTEYVDVPFSAGLIESLPKTSKMSQDRIKLKNPEKCFRAEWIK